MALVRGRIPALPARTSNPLLTLVAKELQEREQSVLLDEQRVADEQVMRAVQHARAANTRRAVVLGGPGFGRSAIALGSVGELHFAALIRDTHKVLLTRGMRVSACPPPTPKPRSSCGS